MQGYSWAVFFIVIPSMRRLRPCLISRFTNKAIPAAQIFHLVVDNPAHAGVYKELLKHFFVEGPTGGPKLIFRDRR
jgi:hypothetical protein